MISHVVHEVVEAVAEERAEVEEDILTKADPRDKIPMEELHQHQPALPRRLPAREKLPLSRKTDGALSLSQRRTTVEATKALARLLLNS
jgi:hypothetical protein